MQVDSAALEAYVVFQVTFLFPSNSLFFRFNFWLSFLSQVYAWKVYMDQKYLIVGANKQILIDETKTLEVLDVFCTMFERFLTCVDEKNADGLKTILDEMSPRNSFIMDVLAHFFE